MKHVLRRICYFVAAMAAAAGVSNASAGGTGVTLHNQTNGCIRTYTLKGYTDTYPWQTQKLKNIESNRWYQASVFSTSTCGGRAVRNVSFYSHSKDDWYVDRSVRGYGQIW